MSPDRVLASSWSASDLDQAIDALARHAGLSTEAAAPEPVPEAPAPDMSAFDKRVQALAAQRGLEAESLTAPFPDLPSVFRSRSPLLVMLPAQNDEPVSKRRLLCLCGGYRDQASLLGPDLRVRRLPVEVVQRAVCRNLEVQASAEIDTVVERAGLGPKRRARVRQALLSDRLTGQYLGGFWLLRLPPGASFVKQLWQVRLPLRLLIYFGTHFAQYLLMLLAWWLVGRGALSGHLDPGWLWAWGLLLFTMVPFQLTLSWTQGMMAITVGGLLKQRLLYGAMRLRPEEIRHMGAGQLLARVMEAEAVEALALGAGFQGVLALVELALAASVLWMGVAAAFHVPMLILWVSFTLLYGWRFFNRSRGWTEARLALTHDLVERMVGHRTRLSQQRPDSWHEGEDESLDRYLTNTTSLDQTLVQIAGVVQRGWMLVALLGLAPAFVRTGATEVSVAVSLGGILLASGALAKVQGSLGTLATAVIAWRQIALLFKAAARGLDQCAPVVEAALSTSGVQAAPGPTVPEAAPGPTVAETPEARPASSDRASLRGPSPSSAPAASERPPTPPLIEARRLVFRYRPTGRPVLDGCDLMLYRGDRLLLQGPSGGGKSTLASLLIGLRHPEAGLVLLDGLDHRSLGADAWRRRVVSAPQFHENHVLTGTFAFNLLMGRTWPASSEDLTEAETICQELGLGELLARMPGGLNQVVGETGWRLSHGERSRLFIARALLQRADLIVLDESFAALDPESLSRALRCVLERAPTLLVIAHP